MLSVGGWQLFVYLSGPLRDVKQKRDLNWPSSQTGSGCLACFYRCFFAAGRTWSSSKNTSRYLMTLWDLRTDSSQRMIARNSNVNFCLSLITTVSLSWQHLGTPRQQSNRQMVGKKVPPQSSNGLSVDMIILIRSLKMGWKRSRYDELHKQSKLPKFVLEHHLK